MSSLPFLSGKFIENDAKVASFALKVGRVQRWPLQDRLLAILVAVGAYPVRWLASAGRVAELINENVGCKV